MASGGTERSAEGLNHYFCFLPRCNAMRLGVALSPRGMEDRGCADQLLDIDWDDNGIMTDVPASSPALVGFGGGRSRATRWACVLRTRDMK